MANWYTSQNTSWLERQAGEVSWDHGWYVQGNDHASSKQETENQLNQHFTTFSLELHFYYKSKLQWPKDKGQGPLHQEGNWLEEKGVTGQKIYEPVLDHQMTLI